MFGRRNTNWSVVMWSDTKSGGNEERCWKTKGENSCGISNSLTVRISGLALEDKAKKKVWICDMACSQQWNIEAKRLEKLTKYRQLDYESRERHPEYEIMVVPQVIRTVGGGIRKTMVDIGKVFESKVLLKR